MPASLLNATMLPEKVTGSTKWSIWSPEGIKFHSQKGAMDYIGLKSGDQSGKLTPTNEDCEINGAEGASIEIPDVAEVLPRRPGHGGNTNLKRRERVG